MRIKHTAMNAQPIAIKFAKWDISPLETLSNSIVYQLREKLNRGEKMSREEKNWLAENLKSQQLFQNSRTADGIPF